MTYKYDLFISHASEDKYFVCPLAEALRRQRLAVWFDEFELKPGMGLRESIDLGLVSSRYGLVVLSPAFFAKSWPRWELDGLVQLAHSCSEQTIIPVWHNVGRSEVANFSPSLANIVAIPSYDQANRVTDEILRVLRPRPATVEVAREVLVQFGFPAPGLSDEWWLDAAVWSAPTLGEDTSKEGSSWGWWGFPLPPFGVSPDAKGQRIAWAAMQHSWQEAAIEQRITQCTHPNRVLEFIKSQPGLFETVQKELDYLLYYAPQLGFPNCGGFLEPAIDSRFREAEAAIEPIPEWGTPGLAMHDPDLCGLHPMWIAERYFWPSDTINASPYASVLAWVDVAAWLSSITSDWLPFRAKMLMTEGLRSSMILLKMGRGDVEALNVRSSKRWVDIMQGGFSALQQSDFVREARQVFEDRVALTCTLLELPESPVELVERIALWGVFESYFSHEAWSVIGN